jgi:hypothetical protein
MPCEEGKKKIEIYKRHLKKIEEKNCKLKSMTYKDEKSVGFELLSA